MSATPYDARIDDLLRDAEQRAAQGDWRAVRALAAAVLALVPEDQRAYALLTRADEAEPSEGEHRQLTIMFCDVVGSTALSHQHDPELVREVLRSYQRACDQVVRRYEGRIARYIGDGVLAYFGHPRPHEDDARRAVKAGLDLMAALEPVIAQVRERYEIDLNVRTAVHTGLVVLGDMGSPSAPDRDAIVGEAPNVAARLQDHARPGTLVISEATLDLVRGWFLVVPLGPQELRGITDPVQAFEVVEEAEPATGVRVQADLSPFVGRDSELDVLCGAWADVQQGGSKSVMISGPAGVGKSRLADVFRRRAEADGATSLVASCSSYHGSTALHPIRRLLERTAGIDPHHGPQQALSRLWQALDVAGEADSLPFMANLLGLPPEPWCPSPELEGPKLREELLARLVAWVRAAAGRNPLVIVVDDLQWADPSTVELLGRVVLGHVPGLLLVLTLREDQDPPWSDPALLTLDRLGPDVLADLASRLPEGRQLSQHELERVIERSDGIPFFLEQLLRSASHGEGDGARSADTIPAALRDLLLARFVVPGVDMRVAQLMATIGGDVPVEVLAAASDLSEVDITSQIKALVGAGVADADQRSGTVRFHHQLLQDLAYDTQVRAARTRAHSRVAAALLALPASERDPAVVGNHLEQAGRPAEAITFLTEAAEAALTLGAQTEASTLLENAFALLHQVEDPQRNELEFNVRLVRGTAVASTLGYAAPATVEDFERCRDLVPVLVEDGYLDDDATGARDPLVWAATGLWATFMLQGRLDDADSVIEGLSAQLRPDGTLRRYFETTTWLSDSFRGEITRASKRLGESLNLLADIDLPDRLAMPSDPKSVGLAHLALMSVMKARPETARAQIADALEAARQVSFPRGPFSTCYIHALAVVIELFCEDHTKASEHCAAGSALAERHGFTFWTAALGLSTAMVDDLLGVPGAADRAEAMIALSRSLGVHVWRPSWLVGLARSRLLAGDRQTAARLVREAEAAADEIDCQYVSAEIGRIRGSLQALEGDPAANATVRGAADLAAEQGATLALLASLTFLCQNGDDPRDVERLQGVLDDVGDVDLPVVVEARAVLSGRG